VESTCSCGEKKPLVWLFPQVLVCLDCGVAQCTVPEAELKLIQQNKGGPAHK
jgi:hypothetical protein